MSTLPHRPVVALDVDGTIAQYHEHFRQFAEQYLGRPLRCDWSRTKDDEFSEALGLHKATYRDIKLAYRQGGMKRSLPLYEGAKELVDAIHEAGAEVWFCTTRPWQRLDNIDPDTRHFFDRNQLTFEGLIYGENKYQDLVEIVGRERIVCVLDDLPDLIMQAREQGLRTWMIQRAHNGHAPDDIRYCGDLGAAKRQIVRDIEKWHKKRKQETLDRGNFGMPTLGSSVRDVPQEMDLPGMWSYSDFEGGAPDEVRGPDWKPDTDDKEVRGPSWTSDNEGEKFLPPPHAQAERVCNIFDEAQLLYKTKAQGYGESDGDDLGVKGQYADMHRKWKRLKAHMWEGKPWADGEESFEEVLMDFMGHIAMTIEFSRRPF